MVLLKFSVQPKGLLLQGGLLGSIGIYKGLQGSIRDLAVSFIRMLAYCQICLSPKSLALPPQAWGLGFWVCGLGLRVEGFGARRGSYGFTQEEEMCNCRDLIEEPRFLLVLTVSGSVFKGS